MYKQKIFKIPHGDKFIVFIPAFSKVYFVSKDNIDKIPDFLIGGEELSKKRNDTLPDYCFVGTNLILTNHCNLSCVYCYGDYSPKKKLVMKKEVAHSAIDYIAKCAVNFKHDLIYANMFGGEPTQAWDIMTSSVFHLREKAKELGLRSRSTISTNGVMDDNKIKWLSENMDRIAISIDGYKDIQNAHRSNSFDSVFSNAKKIYNIAPEKLRFRSTVSDFSVENLPKIVRFLSENFPGTVQAYETLFQIGRGKNSKYNQPSNNLFFDKFIESLDIAKEFNCKLRTSVLNLGGTNTEFCGVIGRNFMITPDGRCTTCNRMSENTSSENSFSYGKFDFNDMSWHFDNFAYQNMKKFSSSNIHECENCFAFSSCRGDCAANKSMLDSENFWKIRSYRCEEIKDFFKKILLYVLERESVLN